MRQGSGEYGGYHTWGLYYCANRKRAEKIRTIVETAAGYGAAVIGGLILAWLGNITAFNRRAMHRIFQ